MRDTVKHLFEFLLRQGDNALILGHRTSEWCGVGPALEEDIALSNISLDLFGQANGFLEYAAKLNGISVIIALTKPVVDLTFNSFRASMRLTSHLA